MRQTNTEMSYPKLYLFVLLARNLAIHSLKTSGGFSGIGNKVSGTCPQVLILFIFILHISAPAQQGWIMQQSGTANSLTSVYFTSADTGIVVGTAGTLLRTTNQGKQWQPVNSGVNDLLTDIAFSDHKSGIAVGGMFGMQGTVLASTNGGLNWTTYSPTPLMLYGVSYTASVVYAVGYLGIILRSTDNGESWIPKPSGLSTPPSQFNRASFIDTSTGIVIGGSGTIIRTENGGDSWEQQESHTLHGLGDVYLHDSKFGIVVGDSGLILRTTNGGKDWLKQESGVSVFLSGVAMADADTGYAVGSGGIILRTINGGITWTIQSSGRTDNLSDVFCLNGKDVFLVGQNGIILYTANAGEITEPPQPPVLISPSDGEQDVPLDPRFNWKPSHTASSYHFQLATDVDFTDLLIDATAVTDTSIVISDLDYEKSYFWRVQAQNEIGWSGWSSPPRMFQTKIYTPPLAFWQKLSLPLEGEINGLIADQTNGLILFIEGKIYRSTDNGETWLLTNDNAAGIRINYGRLAGIDGQNSLYIYNASEAYEGPMVVRSADFGAHWDTVLTFGYGAELSNLSVNKKGDKFVSGWDYFSGGPFVLVSEDGDSWQPYHLDSLQVGQINTWGFSPYVDLSYNYAGSNGYIIRTSDDLTRFEKFAVGEGNGLINQILVFYDPWGQVFASTYDRGVFRSDDNGTTWAYVALQGEFIQAMVQADNNHIFVGTDSSGVLVSPDLGVNWDPQNDGLIVRPIRSMIKGTWYPYIYVQTDSQLYRSRDQFFVSVEQEKAAGVEDFYLKQNYPNPFNPRTTISYYLPGSTQVKLEIYNRLGQLVQVLVNSRQSAGNHHYLWQPGGLASGVYFYRLQTEDRIETKKLLYLK